MDGKHLLVDALFAERFQSSKFNKWSQVSTVVLRMVAFRVASSRWMRKFFKCNKSVKIFPLSAIDLFLTLLTKFRSHLLGITSKTCPN